MKKIITLLSVISIVRFSAQTTLDNTGVVYMKKANLSKTIIINAINNATDYNFDISIKGLKQLSENNIDDEVVILIMNKQKSKSNNVVLIDGLQFDKDEFGLFIKDNGNKAKINSHFTQAQVGRIMKATIPNASADISINRGANTFYFNFSAHNDSTSNSVFNLNNSISDPNEGELVVLSKNGKSREFQAGTLTKSGLKFEIPEKSRIEYKVEKVKHNIYKITTDKNLDAGEYGFIFGAINPGAAMKIYDFTVK